MADASRYTSKLHGARVLVIGGSSGIGYSVAEACLENACSVTISSSSQSRIDAAIASLRKSYPSIAEDANSSRLTSCACDLGNLSTLEENVVQLFEKVSKAHGGQKLDHVVFTAGDALNSSGTAETTATSISNSGTLRFIAPQIIAKHLSAYLVPGPSSSFTMTTGALSERPFPGLSSVSGFGAGIHGLARGLALDLAPIRANAVSPGAVDTPIWDTLDPAVRKPLMQRMTELTLTGRIGAPEDVAEAYLYLMRDWNVTGTILRTDGGALLK